MRIAVFSDIHGNCLALEAVLASLKTRPADQLVCLGDAIQGGPQPAQVVAQLRGLGCPVIMGNADAWMLTGVETGNEAIPEERLRKMGDIREWSLGQLADADQKFIAQFQSTITLPLEAGRSLLCFHGSPASFDDVILISTPAEEFKRYLGEYAGQLLTGGHTHTQQIRRIGDGFFFNPGSVGFAYSASQPEGQFYADPWAEYAVLTSEGANISLEFRRVPFATETLKQIYLGSGRPYCDEAAAQYQ